MHSTLNKYLSKRFIFSFIGLFLLSGMVFCWSKDNIHAIIPGVYYRSAQLSPERLEHLIKTDNIKTIINLRGAWPRKSWYQQERQVAEKYHVKHYDLKLPSHKAPKAKKLKHLTELLENAPRPLLVHCRRGADRTGLAAAMIMLLQGKYAYADADDQIAVRYGAVSSDSVGRLVIPSYKKWLRHRHEKHSKANFLIWINQFYGTDNYTRVGS